MAVVVALIDKMLCLSTKHRSNFSLQKLHLVTTISFVTIFPKVAQNSTSFPDPENSEYYSNFSRVFPLIHARGSWPPCKTSCISCGQTFTHVGCCIPVLNHRIQNCHSVVKRQPRTSAYHPFNVLQLFVSSV